MIPGETFPAAGEIVLNRDRAALSLGVANTGGKVIRDGMGLALEGISGADVARSQAR